MHAPCSLRFVLLLACIAGWLAGGEASVARAQAMRVRRGEELFKQVWKPVQEAGKPDGLGPMFNAASCHACHNQGGVGGASAQNIRLLTVVPPKGHPNEAEQQAFTRRAASIHFGFALGNGTRSTIVLHQHSTDPDYEALRERLLFGLPVGLSGEQKQRAIKAVSQRTRLQTPVKRVVVDGIEFRSSERNSTALFGLGLIDEIPVAALTEIANDQPKQAPGVSGRIAAGGGKFGWRGQIAALDEFVLTSCAVELGLQILPDHPQASFPNKHRGDVPQSDLTDDECESLIAFVSHLPRPEQQEPSDPRSQTAIRSGEQLFASVGCAVCHVPVVGDVGGVYSDLLLHDMGPGLSDPVPAAPQKAQIRTPSGSQSVGYAGGVANIFAISEVTVPTNVNQEWKTPPLWGVASSAPYLHDGRAATLHEAILLHGGEAADSARRYAEAPADSRDRILGFLQTLVAPGG